MGAVGWDAVPAELYDYDLVGVRDEEGDSVVEELGVGHAGDGGVREIQHVRDGLIGADDLVEVGGAKLEIASADSKDGGESVFLGDGEAADNVRRNQLYGLVRHHASDFGEDGIDSGHDLDESVAFQHCVCTLHAVHANVVRGRNEQF